MFSIHVSKSVTDTHIHSSVCKNIRMTFLRAIFVIAAIVLAAFVLWQLWGPQKYYAYQVTVQCCILGKTLKLGLWDPIWQAITVTFAHMMISANSELLLFSVVIDPISSKVWRKFYWDIFPGEICPSYRWSIQYILAVTDPIFSSKTLIQ